MPPLHVPGIHGARSRTLSSRWPLSTAPRLHIDFSPLFCVPRRRMPEHIPPTRRSTTFFHLVAICDHWLLPSVCNPPPFGACSHVGRVIDKGPSRPASSCSAGHHHCFHSQPTSCSLTSQTYDYRLCSASEPPQHYHPSRMVIRF